MLFTEIEVLISLHDIQTIFRENLHLLLILFRSFIEYFSMMFGNPTATTILKLVTSFIKIQNSCFEINQFSKFFMTIVL